jgi:HJR/Mrr/RecB family endonuclease
MAEFDGLKIQRLNRQHYQYLWSALNDVGEIVSDIDNIESKYWEKIQPFPNYFANLNEIEENLDLALGLGLEPLDAARAYFMLMSIWLTKEEEGELLSDDNNVTDTPDLLLFAHNIISLTKTHLVEDFQSLNTLFALRLQRSACLFLNEQGGVAEAERAIAKLKAGYSAKKRNDGKALEEEVKELLQSMGLQATTTRTTGDGGIDIVAYSDSPVFSGKYVVQCKDWAGSVGEGVVRDLYGVVTAEAANKGILITTGTISKSAQKFADGKPLELIDGEQLSKLLSKFKAS